MSLDSDIVDCHDLVAYLRSLCRPNYDQRKEQTNIMMDIKIKERKNTMTEITELVNVMNNRMERAAVMYVIAEQYGTCNCNGEHYGMTVMT